MAKKPSITAPETAGATHMSPLNGFPVPAADVAPAGGTAPGVAGAGGGTTGGAAAGTGVATETAGGAAAIAAALAATWPSSSDNFTGSAFSAANAESRSGVPV